MSTPTLILGNNKWAIEEDNILGYAVEDRNGSYLPREISFTRGSDATYTDSTGVIRQACWNLLQQSETFSNVYWTKLNATIIADTTTDPNGTTTADSIIESSTNGIQEIYRSPAPTVAGTYTYSIYVKNLTGTRFLNLSASATASSDYVSVRFSPSTESLSSVNVSGSFSNGSAFYTAIGNGWYRVVLTFTTTLPPVPQVALSTDGSNGNVGGYGVQTYTGNGTSGLFIWGAQLVQGSDALGYLRTTDRLNVPRVDSSTGTKAFLVEPQRTNLFLSSQQFTSASWLVGGGGSGVFTDNFAISPDGTTNAARWTAAGTNYQTRQNVATINTTATLSVWMRSNSGTKSVTLFINDTTVTSTISVTTTWQRFSVTGAVGATLVGAGRCGFSNNSILTNTDYIEVFGAQYEVGEYLSSYIPTQATTVTRIADSVSKTGISSLIGQSEGTLFFEFDIFGDQNIGRNIGFISDGTINNQVGFFFFNNLLTSRIRSNSTSVFDLNKSSVSSGRHKVAVAYKSGDSAFYLDGVLVSTSTATFTFSALVSQLTIGSNVANIGQLGNGVYKTEVHQTRLTNAELAALTTL